MSEIKQHQAYFEKADYEQRAIKYKRDGGSKLSQEELLIVAKRFFMEGEFAQCLNVLKKVNMRHSSKILFERQSLQFRADFLLKRSMIPNIDNLTKWREMLELVQKQSRNLKGPPLQQHHLQVIKHYADFIQLVEQRLTNKIVLDTEIFRQQKALQSKSKKYQGFPSYMLSQMWIDDFNKAMASRQQAYLCPINNFSIVNDIFQSYHYDDIYEVYKNSVLFPSRYCVPVSKRYWNYLHSLMNEGKQFCPVKRLVNVPQTSVYQTSRAKPNRTQPLIPVVVRCEEEIIALQLTHNRRIEEELYVQIQRKYGLGQFNVKNGQHWQIYDIEGPTQMFFQGFNKILYYNKVQLPRPIPVDQLRPLLKFDFAELPNQYLQDPQNGLKGLQNIGNSCYLNSCIQCLSNTQDLVKFAALNNSLKSINFDQKDGVVVTSFSELLKSIWNKKINLTYINPRKFKRAFGLKNTQFLQKTQEDAHQFLLCLLNCLHEELKQVNSKLLRSISKLQATTDQNRVLQYFQKHFLQQNRSIVMNIFQGKMHNTMKCGSCKIISHSYDVFLALTLPILQQQSQFIDIYFCGWQSKQTKKYRMHLNDMRNAQDLIQLLKKAVQRKNEVQFYYVFGEINKQNLTFQQITLISLERISLLQEMSIDNLLEKAEKSHFIVYQMRKRNENEILALIDYREDKHGLILGFPRLMHFQQKMLKDSIQLKRDIATNDRQNLIRSFDIESLLFQKTKQDKNKPTSNIFDCIIQVILKKSEKLFMGTDIIEDELNDPNTRYSVYDCFDLMRQPQILQGTWVCGNCRRTEHVQKTQTIMQTSNILVIHLKRFKADYRKIKTMIEYPVRGLQINRWIEKKPQGRNYKYDLYAVCLHTGTAQYGHYQAYCKHFVSQKWHQFDDGIVHQIQEQKVVSPHAYMLFYKRVAEI